MVTHFVLRRIFKSLIHYLRKSLPIFFILTLTAVPDEVRRLSKKYVILSKLDTKILLYALVIKLTTKVNVHSLITTLLLFLLSIFILEGH